MGRLAAPRCAAHVVEPALSERRRTGRGPNRAEARAQYRRRAPVYDLELALFEPIRRQAIALLGLRRGEVVLDVGCGTGLSLPLLHDAVGPRGAIVGIEQSPEMIARASERVAQALWRNVTLVCSPVEDARIERPADAALFHFTHDVLRSAGAVANVVAHLKPGARVVACGLQWTRGWAFAANALVLPAALHSVTSLEGLRRPWSRLAARIGPLDVQTTLFGAVYIASGRVPAAPRPRAAQR
jgi:SAM-dependent methyltransferase